jgi:hypothetical protein
MIELGLLFDADPFEFKLLISIISITAGKYNKFVTHKIKYLSTCVIFSIISLLYILGIFSFFSS